MSIRSFIPFVIAATASFAAVGAAQAQPCITNFKSAGVPVLSEITYRSWDLVKRPPAAVLTAIARAAEAEDFSGIRIDKASGTVTALQDAAGSGRPQTLRVTARASGGATRVDAVYTVQAGQIGHEGEVRRGLCNIIGAAGR